MGKWQQYEVGKRALQQQNLPTKKYEEALRKLAAKLGV